MTNSATKLAAVALFAGVLLTGTAHAACKPKTFGSGSGANAGVATNKGIQNWRMNALSAYGAGFDNWLKAQNRGRACRKSGNLTHCRVWGNPCN
jgi:hypothetical protein